MTNEKWEEEARGVFVTDRNPIEESIYWGPFLNGYLAGRQKGQEEIEGLKEEISVNELSLALQDAQDKVKELETKLSVRFIRGKADQMVYDAELVNGYRTRAEQAEQRVKELEASVKGGCFNIICYTEKIQAESSLKELMEKCGS